MERLRDCNSNCSDKDLLLRVDPGGHEAVDLTEDVADVLDGFF
jgi:hypothetical protein